MSEADVHFDFFAHLKAAISERADREAVTYGDVLAEYSDGLSETLEERAERLESKLVSRSDHQ